MKYMGSKRAMLRNGLGEAIDDAVVGARRVFDLFTGSAAVAWHVAEHYEKEVIAGDLQLFSCVLAEAVISRTSEITNFRWLDNWFLRAEKFVRESECWPDIVGLQASLSSLVAKDAALRANDLEMDPFIFPISHAYGGHYFSPWQSIWLDGLRQTLPSKSSLRKVALAALVQAASQCAASPGHTAQPFKPNDTAGPYLLDAWKKDLPLVVRANVSRIASRKAKLKGQAYCMDAMRLAEKVKDGDLVFVDPPYSDVHYSRFYHVLESVSRGKIGPVSGIGRYPPAEERPFSDFSVRTKSSKAFDALLSMLSKKGANVIVTFPAGKASNGLTGDDVKNIASSHFLIREEKVSSRFSTLGGDKKHRAARQDALELILRLNAN